MHWNHQKVSGLYLQKSNQDMAVFSKGIGLKNEDFYARPFLTPLIVSITSTNIWKPVGIFQNPFQDPKNIKIRPSDQILALLKCTQAGKFGLKNWFFIIFSSFINIFVFNGPVHLWKWSSASKYLTGAQTAPFLVIWNWFSPENGQIRLWKLALKNQIFDFFQFSSTFLCPIDL